MHTEPLNDLREQVTLIGDDYEVLLKAMLLESYTGKRPKIYYLGDSGDFHFDASLPTFPYLRPVHHYGEAVSPFDDIGFDAKQVTLLVDNTNTGYTYRGNLVYDAVCHNLMSIERISSEIPETPNVLKVWVPTEADWLYELEERYFDKVITLRPNEVQEYLEKEERPVYSCVSLPKLLGCMGIPIRNSAGVSTFKRNIWTINLEKCDGHFLLYSSTKEMLGYLIWMAHGRISFALRNMPANPSPADEAFKKNRHLMNNRIFKDIDDYTSISIHTMSEENIIEMPAMYEYTEFDIDCLNYKQLQAMYDELDEQFNIKLIPSGRKAQARYDRVRALQDDPILKVFG